MYQWKTVVISGIGYLVTTSFVLMLLCISSLIYASDEKQETNRINIADFSSANLASWDQEVFDGITSYTLVNMDGRQVVKAQSHDSASGLFKEVKIDLYKTPYLNWSWRVDSTPGQLNERSREGDDYAARVYVVDSGGLFFWKTKALNYVWSSSQKVGSVWNSAYTDHSKMIAIQGYKGRLGQWLTEKRNVRMDFREQFGKDIRYIDAVAIMTDTDNSGGKATAYYGDIYFSDQ